MSEQDRPDRRQVPIERRWRVYPDRASFGFNPIGGLLQAQFRCTEQLTHTLRHRQGLDTVGFLGVIPGYEVFVTNSAERADTGMLADHIVAALPANPLIYKIVKQSSVQCPEKKRLTNVGLLFQVAFTPCTGRPCYWDWIIRSGRTMASNNSAVTKPLAMASWRSGLRFLVAAAAMRTAWS